VPSGSGRRGRGVCLPVALPLVSPPPGAGRHCDAEDWRQVVSIVRVDGPGHVALGSDRTKRLAGREVCPGELL